jgi:ParB family chromosome partitioning protein
VLLLRRIGRPNLEDSMDQPKYALVNPAPILANPNDKRDRTAPAYQEWLAKLTKDVKERGIRNPLLVMRQGDALVLLAGETRRQAALGAGLEKVPVNILDRPLTPGEMLLETLQENEMRRNFTDLERAELFVEIMLETGWTQGELAHHSKVSPGQVSKALAVSSKLPDDVKALIGKGEGKVGPRAAYQISRLPNEEMMRDLAKKLADGLLTADALEVEVAKRLGKPLKKAAKAVKGKTTHGLSYVLPADFTTALTEMAALTEAIKKAEKLGLSMASVPALLSPRSGNGRTTPSGN